MSDHHMPPLGDLSPVAYTCVRETGPVMGAAFCGRPATHHILWASLEDSSIGCDEHFREALAMYPVHDSHELGAECVVPGSLWTFGEGEGPSRCVVEGGPLAVLDMVAEPEPAEA